jgi:GDP-L-fucose synthase
LPWSAGALATGNAADPPDDAGEHLYFLNVGTGLDVSIHDLAETDAIATGFTVNISLDTSKPDGTPKKQLDVSRQGPLGWRTRIPLVEGLVSTVAMFRQGLDPQFLRL